MALIGKRVFVASKTFPQAGLDILKQNGFQAKVIDRFEHDLDYLTEIKNNITGHDGIIWNTKKRLNAEMLDLAGPQLKAVTTMSSGLDHIDLPELEKRGILLGRTHNALDKTVAEHGVGLMIGAARKFKEGIETVHRGKWKFGVQWNLGQGIEGSTVGIVGLGGIGQQVVKRLKPFHVHRFLYTGRYDKPEAKELGVERVPLEQLLKESDFVILSCAYTDETKNLINAQRLELMKKNAVLVNIARGGVVDTNALYVALKENKIFAAGLDVVEPEPINCDHPIVSLSNCLLVPHYGSATVQTRNKMAENAADNITAGLLGKDMPYPVILSEWKSS